MAQDWDIKPRDEACTACQTPFTDRQPYHSALVFDKDGYRRADYCEPCWAQQKPNDGLPYSSWQGIFQMPAPEPEEPLRKETAESLLRKLMEQEDPSKTSVIYILAVMLERNRLLAEKDIQNREDGTMIRIYEHRKTGETFMVPDPRLRLDQLETVQQEVMDLLGITRKPGGERAPENPVPEKPATESPTA